jgi:predicted DNA-binding protein
METKLTTTKILHDQILIVFTVVLATTWFTIESKSSWLGFQAPLDPPWLEFVGMRVYLPPTFLWYMRRDSDLLSREAIVLEEPKRRREFALLDRSSRTEVERWLLRLVPRRGGARPRRRPRTPRSRMKKMRLSIYLDPEMMARLTELSKRKGRPKSLIAEAAIATQLTSDEANRLEAIFVRRLDILTGRVERMERDHSIGVETLALFIRFWLIVTPSLPESEQAVAQAKGRERYESFLETLGRRLAKGQSFLRQVSVDKCDLSIASRQVYP